MITVFLRFADADTAVAAVRDLLLHPAVAAKIDAAAAAGIDPFDVVSMGYTSAGTRFDLARVEGRPGDGDFHLNLLWHGAESDLPDFGAARLFPETPSQVFAE
jgi:hypothetical protein